MWGTTVFGHHILMIGSPGAGKSMLAQRLPSILPPLSPAELLEISMIASVAGELDGGALTSRRPFRSPHHSASMAALTGGGMRAKPGEISLAHNGVLFLDELPEFDPRVIDALRQPLENGEIAVSRANHRVTYPARFMLVAIMNPCRCGHAYDPGYTCKRGRNDRCIADYQARISGPLIDRIDLRMVVAAVTAADLILPPPEEELGRCRGQRCPPRATSRSAATRRSACRKCAPIRKRRRPFSKTSRSPTLPASNSCAMPPKACVSWRAAITAYVRASRARSPTSTLPSASAGCISPKRCPIARLPKAGCRRRDARRVSRHVH